MLKVLSSTTFKKQQQVWEFFYNFNQFIDMKKNKVCVEILFKNDPLKKKPLKLTRSRLTFSISVLQSLYELFWKIYTYLSKQYIKIKKTFQII